MPAPKRTALPENVVAWFALLTQLDALRVAVDSAPPGVVSCKRLVSELLDSVVEEFLLGRPTLTNVALLVGGR